MSLGVSLRSALDIIPPSTSDHALSLSVIAISLLAGWTTAKPISLGGKGEMTVTSMCFLDDDFGGVDSSESMFESLHLSLYATPLRRFFPRLGSVSAGPLHVQITIDRLGAEAKLEPLRHSPHLHLTSILLVNLEFKKPK